LSVLALGLVGTLLAGCSTVEGPGSAPAPGPLRVGVTSDAPPYAFRREGRVVGLEIDFALGLAEALGRRLELMDLPWSEQIPALLAGRTDMVMAGMTITRAREVRIAFSDPYLRSGLLALMRRGDTGRYPSPESIMRSSARIGIVDGTTGDRFVRERCPDAMVSVYPTARAAVDELRQRRVDLLVHDAPVVLWFASADEANLGPLLKLLHEEPLGWGFRQSDEALRTAVNGILAGWKADGTLDRVLTRWIPYWRRLGNP
jgi:polar amino acid transport system substrate-binding protein